MKRVAVCFAGQPRFFEQTVEYFNRHLFNLPNVVCDLFIHSWNYDDSIGKPYIRDQPHKGIIPSNYKQVLLDKNPVVAVFSPPLYSVEEATTVDHFITMQMYSRNQVIDIVNNYIIRTNTIYEYCVITRPDLVLFNDCEFPPDGQLGCVEWPTWFDDDGRNMLNDQLITGSISIITDVVRRTYIEHKQKGIWKQSKKFWFCEELLGIASQHILRYLISTRFSLKRDGRPDGI